MPTKTEIRNDILAIDPNAVITTTISKPDLETMLSALQANPPTDLAVDTEGNTFKTDFDMSAAFSWNQMQDEQHAPSDLLTNYPEPFQAEVMKLRAINNMKKMKEFGKWAFDNLKPHVGAKAWNYWCIDYRIKQGELTPPITEHGGALLVKTRDHLNACASYQDVKAAGKYWYQLQQSGQLESEWGMNSTEIDALWKEFSIVKARWEAMTNGLGFMPSPF